MASYDAIERPVAASDAAVQTLPSASDAVAQRPVAVSDAAVQTLPSASDAAVQTSAVQVCNAEMQTLAKHASEAAIQTERLAVAPASASSQPTDNSDTPPALPDDQPLIDNLIYGSGPHDAMWDVTERAAVTRHEMELNGSRFTYTVTAGHLTTADAVTSQPNAKMFYVAYTKDNSGPSRPITFFYNGGGSSSIYLLLGSFGPQRIEGSMPNMRLTPPHRRVPNPDTLLDQSDLVFINAVGSGYSAAIAPCKNQHFWGVEQDARSVAQFIKRYLDKNGRWNAPRFLFGHGDGADSVAIASRELLQDGIALNGLILVAPALDHSKRSNLVGMFPTLAAVAMYHGKTRFTPAPADVHAFAKNAKDFAAASLMPLLRRRSDAGRGGAVPHLTLTPEVAELMSGYIGIDAQTILRGSNGMVKEYFTKLAPGRMLSAHDGRMSVFDAGIASHISPHGHPADMGRVAVEGIYVEQWNDYLGNDLKYTSTSSFVGLNDHALKNWDCSHVDASGKRKRYGLNAADDLAWTMTHNRGLRVLVASGYYDSLAPFYQTELTLDDMKIAWSLRKNIKVKHYPAGHLVYLDDASRRAMRGDLAWLYSERRRVQNPTAGTATETVTATATATETETETKTAPVSVPVTPPPTPTPTATLRERRFAPAQSARKPIDLRLDVNVSNSYYRNRYRSDDDPPSTPIMTSGTPEDWKADAGDGSEKIIEPRTPGVGRQTDRRAGEAVR